MQAGRARLAAVVLATTFLSACGTPRPSWMPLPATPPPRRPAPTARVRTPAPPPAPLAPAFAENRGRLPWPVDGIVIGMFGTRIEPEYGTRTDAPGIDIATAPAAPVTAVFSGVVARVGTMAAYGQYVMLRHGAFTTIYGNLSDVSVEEAVQVQTGAPIGLAGTDLERRGAGIFFAVFDGDDAVNPLPWLGPAP